MGRDYIDAARAAAEADRIANVAKENLNQVFDCIEAEADRVTSGAKQNLSQVFDCIDSEADRIVSEAKQNLKQVILSFRNCLQVVHKTREMLEVDPQCICVNSKYGEFKWKRRRELDEVADSIEILFSKSLVELETRLTESDMFDDMLVQPKQPAIVGDDNFLWCSRVCVYEKVDMDSAVWCTTPPTIMELVFARLPLHQIFQMRGLSKHWQASIMSPSFQHAFGTTTSRRFAIVTYQMNGLRLWSFGTKERKWYGLPFDCLPIRCDYPVAEDGGLLCCRRQFSRKGTKSLYVCNPLTQAWRKLSLPLQVRGFDLVHLVTDRQTKHYTITVVSDLQQNEHHSRSAKAIVEVYDSATKTWSASSNGVFQSGGNNLFYYKKYVEEKFVGIRAYNKTTGYSTSIPFDFFDDIIFSEMKGFCPMAEHQGQVYVLRTEEAKSGVWVLRTPSHAWEKLYSVPNPELLKYYLFSLIVSTDAIIIFGDQRWNHDDTMEVPTDVYSEEPGNPYFWMLDRSQETWIDIYDINLDYCPWSQIMFEMRLDGIP